jgi:hypothetical protein
MYLIWYIVVMQFSICFSMSYLLDCLFPKEQSFFQQFTQKEFELLKAIEENALASISDTEVIYQTPEALEEGRFGHASISMAIALFERIRYEKDARFFPRDQFHVYLRLKYGNNCKSSLFKATLLQNGYFKELLQISRKGLP